MFKITLTSEFRGVSVPLLVLLLTTTFVSSTLSFFLLLTYIFANLLRKKSLSIPNNRIDLMVYLFMIFCSCCVGLSALVMNEISLYNFFKDVYYYIQFIALALASFFFTIKKDMLFRTVVVYASIHAVCYVVSAVLYLLNNGFSAIYLYRFTFVGVGLGESVAIVILLFKVFETPFCHYLFSKKMDNVILVLCLVTVFLQLSRTAILVLLLMCIPFVEKKHFPMIIKAFTMGLCGLIVVLIIMPSGLAQLWEKFLYSFQEISFNRDSWSLVDIQQSWRGYEKYLVVQELAEMNVFELLLGKGAGSSLHTQYAYLVSDSADNSLFMLHDGYYTALYKTGMFGLSCLVLVFIYMLHVAISNKNEIVRRFQVGMVISMIVLAVIVNGIVYASVGNQFILLLLFNVLATESSRSSN